MKINLFAPKFFFKRIKLLFNKVDDDIRKSYLKANSLSKASYITSPLWLRVLLQPYKLIRKTKKNLSKITIPVLGIHSKGDETTSFKSASMFEKLLINSNYESLILKESWHAYYTKAEREMIKERITDFILQ